MKRNNSKQIMAICMSVILMLGACAVPVYANSAQTQFEGVDSTGAIMTDSESPIIVERELLTFDIAEFPKDYYSTKNDYLEYGAKVTAEYTFYNPSEYSVTAKLLFPFGNAPHYVGGEYDDAGNYTVFDDTSKFDITVNGEVVEKKIRHTLSSQHEQFKLEQDLALISDDFVSDNFYKTDLSVTKYVFKISGVDIEQYKSADVGFDVPKGIGSYLIYFPEQNGAHTQDNGEMRIHTGVEKNEREFELYVFGTPLSEMPDWKVYENGGVEDNEEISGTVTLVSTETTTFKEFALSNRSETSVVSESDWYNALVSELKDSIQHSGEYPIVDAYRYERGFDNCLMRWYEYEITLAPGERIVNAVTAPMYPAINLGYEPDIFKYTYLLSPAKTWKSFGELEIAINTPYYITESNIEGFTKTDNGYSLKLNGLPDGELTFTLSTSAEPKKPIRTLTDYIPVEMIISFSIIGGVVLLVGGGITAFVLIRRKKRDSDAQ